MSSNTSEVVSTSNFLCKLMKIKHCSQWWNHLRMELKTTKVCDIISSDVIAKSTEVTTVFKVSVEYECDPLLQALPPYSLSHIFHLHSFSCITRGKRMHILFHGKDRKSPILSPGK